MLNYPSSIFPLFSKDTLVECFICSIKFLQGGHAKVDLGNDLGISSLVKNSSVSNSSMVALSAGFSFSIREIKRLAGSETLELGKE